MQFYNYEASLTKNETRRALARHRSLLKKLYLQKEWRLLEILLFKYRNTGRVSNTITNPLLQFDMRESLRKVAV